MAYVEEYLIKMLLIICALLLLAAAGVMVYAMLKQQRDASIITQRISLPDGTGMATERRRTLIFGLGQLDGKLDAEVPKLLDQLGWRSAEQRARY